ncbi:hypothetical protein, partial [Thermocatellispora tengchongensis]|uniref:hypothetical protein n=1 Tax=Thermocatellispora tengchongensis TaxID=1073253 RepID=UPI0031E5AED6
MPGSHRVRAGYGGAGVQPSARSSWRVRPAVETRPFSASSIAGMAGRFVAIGDSFTEGVGDWD